MTLAVTTRAGNGNVALSHTQMDDNLELLAQDATTGQQGNIEIATQAEVNALADPNRAITPSSLDQTVKNIINSYPRTTYNQGTAATEGETKDLLTGVEEKWGLLSAGNADDHIITFASLGLTNHANGNYNVMVTGDARVDNDRNYHTYNRSATSFTVWGTNGNFLWRTIGL